MTGKVHLGFLTVVDCGDNGYVGGFLLLNQIGRPLEFHCTVPIKPNRAQEILFGPTLRPYLFGEQIGATLVSRARQRPDLVLTDDHDAFEISRAADLPIVWLCSDKLTESTRSEACITKIDILSFQAAIATRQFESSQLVQDTLKYIDPTFDLLEPFERIREAVNEAQKAA